MEPSNTPEKTKSMYPSDLLRVVAQSMNHKDREIIVTVPFVTTWKHALQATQSALGEADGMVIALPVRTEAQQKKMREQALQNVKDGAIASARPLSSTQSFSGQPIRYSFDTASLPFPKPLSEKAQKLLKENAKPSDKDFRQPYHLTHTAYVTEEILATVKATVDMLWDTGAHQTIITEEFLSDSFRATLKDPIHDPYRTGSTLRVQLDASVAFSNTVIEMSAIVLVVPKSQVPNERVGIIFGQTSCIDRISYHTIPQKVLRKMGAQISDDVWGDIIIDRYIDDEEDLVDV